MQRRLLREVSLQLGMLQERSTQAWQNIMAQDYDGLVLLPE